MAFIPNPNNLPEINHKNGIKNDNRVENLEWATAKDNQLHACFVLGRKIGESQYGNFLSEEDVINIYNLCKTDMKRVDIAKMYGIRPDTIPGIIRNKDWKHLNFEPLPVLPRGTRSKGRNQPPRRLYKIIDTCGGEETIFASAVKASNEIGCSAPHIISCADGKRGDILIHNKYKIKTLPWIKGIPRNLEKMSLTDYEKYLKKECFK